MTKSDLITTVYLLLLISAGYFSTDIYLPSLPALSAYFQTQDRDVQMTLFTYILSFSLIPLIAGPLSDHIGRKKVILTGLVISIVAAIGCLFSPSIHWLSAFRFLQGMGMGAVLISSRASGADLFTGRAFAKQMSLTTMLMPLVLGAAPTLGGVLQEKFQWQAVFLFLIGYLLCLLVLTSIRAESLKHFSDRKLSSVFSVYRSFLKNPLFLAFAIPFILPSFGLFAYFTASPFLFQKIVGLSPIEYGSLGLYVAATIVITGFFNLKLIHYFSHTKILSFGIILTILSGCLLLIFHLIMTPTTWSILVPSLLYFTCMPLCIANAASKCMSLVHQHFGAATALLTTFQFLIGALGSLTFSLAPDDSVLPLALAFISVGVLSFIGLRYARKLEVRKNA